MGKEGKPAENERKNSHLAKPTQQQQEHVEISQLNNYF